MIAPARPLKHHPSVRLCVLVPSTIGQRRATSPRPRHGGELGQLPGCTCDHTCVPPLPLKLLLFRLASKFLLVSSITPGALEEKTPAYCRNKSSLMLGWLSTRFSSKGFRSRKLLSDSANSSRAEEPKDTLRDGGRVGLRMKSCRPPRCQAS